MWRGIFVVFAKEVVDNSRDRRSLLVALIYPLLGPIILGLLISAVIGVVAVKSTTNITLPVNGIENAPELAKFLEGRGVTVVPGPADPETAVREGMVESVVVIPESFGPLFRAQQTATLSIVANTSRLSGLVALNRTAVLLGDFNRDVWGERIRERGIDFRVLQPLHIASIDVTSGTHIAKILLFMVPPLIIFNLFMGGVYLAIDATSGERERGSLEPLLVNPVERWGLMLGKYLAALLFTTIAVIVQLMAFKIVFQVSGNADVSFAHLFDMATVIKIIGLTLPLMMVAVGVQFIIATVTRSFKEAQTYLGLLPLVPAIPGMVMVFAPVHAQTWMMAIPTFSQTLLLGRFVRGDDVAFLDAVISMSSSMIVALIFIAFAARLYERENLIFGG